MKKYNCEMSLMDKSLQILWKVGDANSWMIIKRWKGNKNNKPPLTSFLVTIHRFGILVGVKMIDSSDYYI
jgi:hypothetical protein